MKKTLCLIVISLALLLATACSGGVKQAIETDSNNLKISFENFRNGKLNDADFPFVVNEKYKDYPEYQEFLRSSIQEQLQDDDVIETSELLSRFICCLENATRWSTLDEDLIIEGIQTDISEWFDTKVQELDPEDIVAVNRNIGCSYVDIGIKRNSPGIVAYIEKHGLDEINTEQGTGYYANCKDSTSRENVGISGSNLYRAEDIYYYGDFKCVHSYGVEFNYDTYKEESYDRKYAYFRDETIDLSLFENRDNTERVVASGKYVFFFDSDEYLVEFWDGTELWRVLKPL